MSQKIHLHTYTEEHREALADGEAQEHAALVTLRPITAGISPSKAYLHKEQKSAVVQQGGEGP